MFNLTHEPLEMYGYVISIAVSTDVLVLKPKANRIHSAALGSTVLPKFQVKYGIHSTTLETKITFNSLRPSDTYMRQ